MVCAFTGHRQHRLPWGSNTEDARAEALRILMKKAAERAVEAGCTVFLCGMARGCDTYFAEVILQLKCVHPELRLVAMVPCPTQSDRWTAEEKAQYQSLLSRCDTVEILETGYTEGCNLRRNAAMIARADRLISVFDGAPGGTAYTVKLARQKGIYIDALWL